jgi:hypothetical protein
MMRTCFLRQLACAAGLALLLPGRLGAQDATVVRGADELFWVPTLEQALDMAKATGRPLFLMGYSLVGDGSTYTKFGDEFCTGVF